MRSVRQRKRKHAIFKGSGGTRFGVPTSPGVNPLTLEQLGKLVAMSVRWPLFFSDLEQDHDLLAKLHNWQMTPRSDAEISVVGRYWLAKNSFTQLLEFPLLPNKERPEMDSMARFRLDRVDVSRFLRVGRTVAGRETGDTHQQARESQAQKEPTESRKHFGYSFRASYDADNTDNDDNIERGYRSEESPTFERERLRPSVSTNTTKRIPKTRANGSKKK